MTVEGDARAHRPKKHSFFWELGAHHVHKHHARHHRKHHARHAAHHKALPPIVVAHVHVGSQTMEVDVNGASYGLWQVSTAGRGYHTPHGVFGAQRLARVYYSKKYDNSPMPNSVFFSGGNAIHGTNHIHSLGHPASHGCVRLLPQHAAELFALVERYGMGRTRIVISD
ncbi:MAG: L,D-transpeptidase [Alphaproteobacteria bacterium]|nr:L,D-transpeptidase [Alphaproteobacteria bacterium]